MFSPSAEFEASIGGLEPRTMSNTMCPSWLPPIFLVLCTRSRAGTRLHQTRLQAHQAGFKLAKTGFSHHHFFSGQAGINTPGGALIKVGEIGIPLSVDSTPPPPLVSTNQVDPHSTSKASKYPPAHRRDCTLSLNPHHLSSPLNKQTMHPCHKLWHCAWGLTKATTKG